jgi:hypothetical protein
MKTVIKNKQTGETLTGKSFQPEKNTFGFHIDGCRVCNTLYHSEWEILPPPLPTGIGAVVKDGCGENHSGRKQ